MPRKPWNEVTLDFWGQIHTGKFQQLTVYKQSRLGEVEFVTSIGARAVISKLGKKFASLGTLVSASCDNRPPFNGQYVMVSA